MLGFQSVEACLRCSLHRLTHLGACGCQRPQQTTRIASGKQLGVVEDGIVEAHRLFESSALGGNAQAVWTWSGLVEQ